MAKTPKKIGSNGIAIDPLHATATQVGRLYGVTRQGVANWHKKMGCPRGSDGSYDLATVIAWHEKAFVDDPTSDDTSPALERWREARADREEIQLAELQEQMVSIKHVQRYAATLHASVKQDSRSMVEAIMLKLGLTPEQGKVVHAERVAYLHRVVDAIESDRVGTTNEQ